MAVVTSIVIAGVGAAAAVNSGIQAKKASSAAGKAASNRAQIARLENARSRRNQVRQARLAQGQNLARAATRGGSGFGTVASSSAQGTATGIQSQLKSNLSFLDKASALNELASSQEINASKLGGQANLFAGVSSAASSVGSLFNAAPPRATATA
jgi:hypothetical protein